MKWRKPLSLALSAALSLSLAVPALAADETPAPWYAEAQAYVTDKGYMTGTDKGFEPDGTVDRATVFQTLYNLEGKPAPENSTVLTDGGWEVDAASAYFTDTTATWYSNAANWAVDAGLAKVPEDKLFNGERAITRAEIAAIFSRYAQMDGWMVDVTDSAVAEAADYAAVPAWAAEDMAVCYELGLMTGDQNGNLNPAATASRAELATLLMKLDTLVPAYTEETVAIEVPETDGIPAHAIPAIVTIPGGEGTFPAVVMLHGTGSDKHEAGGGYDLAAPAMATSGIATIRFDFMGNGESEADYSDYNYTSANIDAKAAADYMAALDAVDGGKLAVMGWSQGGTNALLAAAAYPETFKAVITWSGATKLDGVSLFGDKTFDQAYAAAKKDGAYTMEFDWREPLQVGERWFREVKETDVLKETAKISAPVLAINGDKDDVVPMDNAEAIQKAAQNGRTWIAEGADHTYNVFTETESGYPTIGSVINVGIGFLEETLNGALEPAYALSVSKYGNVTTTMPVSVFDGAGYCTGDILKVTVGDTTIEAPYGTGYSNVDTGSVIVLPDGDTGTVAIAINMGNFAGTYSVTEETPIVFSMGEKEGYLEEYEIRNIDSLRTNDRKDYKSDEIFANFREIKMGDIAAGTLYRSASPVNPELGRNTYADALAKKAGVKTFINLADDEETLKAYEGYAESYYGKQNVAALNMGVDFAAPEFAEKLKTGLEFMIANEGPYLIHCTEGKDRAGFVSMLLEALMGGKKDEIVNDYMLSFENYYGVEHGSDRWTRIAQSNIISNLLKLTGAEDEKALDKADLVKAAETYLTDTVGLTAEQVTALKDVLSGK